MKELVELDAGFFYSPSEEKYYLVETYRDSGPVFITTNKEGIFLLIEKLSQGLVDFIEILIFDSNFTNPINPE